MQISRDAQSTEKSVFYGFLSLVSVYGPKNYLWTNLRIFSYSIRLLPSPSDPIALSRFAVFRAHRVNFFRLLPPLEISGFFGIPIGQPWIRQELVRALNTKYSWTEWPPTRARSIFKWPLTACGRSWGREVPASRSQCYWRHYWRRRESQPGWHTWSCSNTSLGLQSPRAAVVIIIQFISYISVHEQGANGAMYIWAISYRYIESYWINSTQYQRVFY